MNIHIGHVVAGHMDCLSSVPGGESLKWEVPEQAGHPNMGCACVMALPVLWRGGGGGGRGADSAQPQLHLPGVMTNVMIAFSFFSIRYGALNHH